MHPGRTNSLLGGVKKDCHPLVRIYGDESSATEKRGIEETIEVLSYCTWARYPAVLLKYVKPKGRVPACVCVRPSNPAYIHRATVYQRVKTNDGLWAQYLLILFNSSGRTFWNNNTRVYIYMHLQKTFLFNLQIELFLSDPILIRAKAVYEI